MDLEISSIYNQKLLCVSSHQTLSIIVRSVPSKQLESECKRVGLTVCIDLLVSSLQCAGLVVCGANAAYQTSELVHQLKDSDSQIILVHPSILDVALASTTQLGWTKTQQRKKIVLAMTRAEAGPAADLFQCFDDLISYQLLSPHPIQNPETTVAFIGYSSGTSGAAKGKPSF